MRYLFSICLLVGALNAHAAQGIPQIPQIPAFLPMANTVPMRASAPIDGEWMINSIGKRIRIQGGRAYALDPWLHMFVLQVKPMMVVLTEISTVDGQNYTGKDLPLLGTWTATLDRDGNLNATVQTMVGPVRYGLMPVRVDDQQAFELAKAGEHSAPERAQPDYDQPEREERKERDEAPDREEDETSEVDSDEGDWDEWD